MSGNAGPLLLVGGGKMGSALLEGWLAGGLAPEDAWLIEPDPKARQRMARLALAGLHASADEISELRAKTILLAVKPQVMDAAISGLRHLASPTTLILSIAAGKPIATFEQAFGKGTPVIRVMPNTPSAVGRGMSVLCANDSATAEQRQMAETLMAAVGDTAWVEDEDLMHAVTAVSGSGPAYVFHLVETLAAAGVAAGLPEALAIQLARRTVAGSGALVDASSETAAQLRINVTSPRGTTEAALEQLMASDGLADVMRRTVEAAARRSRELA